MQFVAGVTCQTDPLIEESRTLGKGWRQLQRTWRYLSWPACAALLHMSCLCLGVLVDCGSRPIPVLCCNFPRVRVNCKCLERGNYADPEKLLWSAFLLVARQIAVYWGVDGLDYVQCVPPSGVAISRDLCERWAGMHR